MENLVISKLNKEDIPGAARLIQPLYETIVENRKDIFISTEQNWEEYLTSRLQDEDSIVIVAIYNNEVVGVCASEIKHCGDNIETRIRDILFVDYITVAEKHRGRKIGGRLLDEVKKIAKDKNISTVELNVWGFNHRAIKFYESNKMNPKRIVYEYLIDKGE